MSTSTEREFWFFLNGQPWLALSQAVVASIQSIRKKARPGLSWLQESDPPGFF